ncbi:acyl-CoA N-acyltransferase [Mycena crocata]|nr:acyl-CoA N-acyltransferase [Mycena crocata]
MSNVESYSILSAEAQHADSISTMVNAAYSHYIERIGKPPAPMTADYAQLIETQDVYVLRNNEDSTILGSIVLCAEGNESDKSIKVNNLVVNPAAQGRGFGRRLMDHAEDVARARGYTALTLFTNVKMHENIALYAKMGFVEVGRRIEDGYERVYFRKEL